jgi:uncharacterized protein (DUF433 family)
MEKPKIEIVDRGRGLQLSTSRVTVQDLVPYFQEGCTHEEIQRWIPTLSDGEIAVVEAFYIANKQLLDEDDRRIRANSTPKVNPDWVEKIGADARSNRQSRRDRLAESAVENGR